MSSSSSATETYELAFTTPPGPDLAGIPTASLNIITPHVSSGLPYEQACARHISSTFAASKAYIVASKTLAATTDRLDRLIAAIGKDHVVGVRKGITPHTPWSEILSIAVECRDAGADCIVTLGAGSLTDGCKIVALCLANNIRTSKELATYSLESKIPPAKVHEPTVSLICIPTSLSGGEYFSLAGGTDDTTGHKQPFLHSGMGARLVILDPELCLTTPEYHWLSTGIRAVDHCVEALCCLTATEESDRKAEEGLRLLVPGLLRCKADGDGKDVEARAKCQAGVKLGMECVRMGVPMGGSHAIGHQLGPLGVPHGVTSCIMCPAVMKYNIRHSDGKSEIKDRQLKVEGILWSESEVAVTLRDDGLSEANADLGDCLSTIIKALGLPQTLKKMSISPDVIPALSERALADFWSPTNPVPLLKAEQVSEILEALAG
nr:hypothetical protein B0A51_11311 [Rachicladosporium sp. CCFEE 5018]